MYVELSKQHRGFLVVSVWFVSIPALLSFSVVAWNYVQRIVIFGATVLILAFFHMDTLAAKSNSEQALMPPQVVSSETYLLAPKQ